MSLIIFGTSPKEIASPGVPDIPCPGCGKERLGIFIYQTRFHLFWVPMFPMGKSATVACWNCRREFTEGELSPELQKRVADEVKKAKSPASSYIGVIIIGGFILLFFLLILRAIISAMLR